MEHYLVYVMGLVYIVAGLNHFRQPEFYEKMINGFLKYPIEIIYISSLAEILLGIGVCISATRQWSAFGIILLLIIIFPANLNMALHPADWKFSKISLYLRLALQLLLIYWAYLYT